MGINWQRIPFGQYNSFVALLCLIAMYIVGVMMGWKPDPPPHQPCVGFVDVEEVEP
jgi:hypothetical protein